MEAFLVSTGTVALAEIGDKTQLLSLILAARFRAPLAIILGILVATLLNHAISAWLGIWITNLISAETARIIVATSFLLVAVWILIPDKQDDTPGVFNRMGVFWATAVLFFLAKIGDKTQVATVILAAQYQSLIWVTLGTSLGMLLANIPVILFGQQLMKKMPLTLARYAASAVFMVLGIASLVF